ncbi:KpsF/GutQ family sugar-phosphate isomerase [Vogesella indigofera]|jgi:arabinose-5-phosphate isomerase|uniref:KpsF/GutQ family sugar-phosphate isomerase n=1 Tax=Vogesella indigofera TaxID=45465 RepID=UPI00234C4C5C|nr:KpsF/GutQ family sugar-phosphate isomerase [Vogesella indigofera]MDC7702539.1 KpsF/GutQ family sugar-phosphate isomerase [Vogesella indigofera]MDC7705723.1 KpsF/GutQ family sugar-phosphate isomerase [Vogesella indigofera]
MKNDQKQSCLALARDVLAIEAAAITRLASRLDDSFSAAVALILACEGRVVVSGMGKSGHIGNKIAATLASTGTPAFFMHPAEAAHGDLGMLTERDILLALSNSGESDELLALLPALKRKGVPIIALTGRPQSTLATEASIHLDAGVEKEACPLGLAPTASTTAALALGDALAVALLDARDFKPEDFALSHPGGSLGRKLLVHISDLMHGGEALPRVISGSSLKDALLEMTRKGLGMTAVCAADGQLLGIFTDGDLRRTLDKSLDLAGLRIDDVMARQPRTIESHRLATEAANEMEHHKINGLLVTDRAGNLVGALNMHDLLKAGVV